MCALVFALKGRGFEPCRKKDLVERVWVEERRFSAASDQVVMGALAREVTRAEPRTFRAIGNCASTHRLPLASCEFIDPFIGVSHE